MVLHVPDIIKFVSLKPSIEDFGKSKSSKIVLGEINFANSENYSQNIFSVFSTKTCLCISTTLFVVGDDFSVHVVFWPCNEASDPLLHIVKHRAFEKEHIKEKRISITPITKFDSFIGFIISANSNSLNRFAGNRKNYRLVVGRYFDARKNLGKPNLKQNHGVINDVSVDKLTGSDHNMLFYSDSSKTHDQN